MRFARFFLVAVAVSAAFGCGSDDESLGTGPAQLALAETDAEFGKLIPADATALIHVPAPQELAVKFLELGRTMDPERFADVGEDQALSVMLEGLDLPPLFSEVMDPDRPMAIAVTFENRRGEPRPRVTFVMGCKDQAKVEEEFQDGPAPVHDFHGSYLRITELESLPAPSDSVPDLAKGMAAGDITVRMDFAKFMGEFGPSMKSEMGKDIERSKDRLPPEQAGVAKVMDWMMGAVTDLIDSSEQLDLALSLDGTTLSVQGLYSAKEGSALGSARAPGEGLGSLAGCLPSGFPMVVMVNLDWGGMMETMKPLMDGALSAMPEEGRKVYLELMDRGTSLMDMLGDQAAMAFDLGPNGLRGVMLYLTTDGEAYVEKSMALVKEFKDQLAEAGMELTMEPVREVNGCTVHTQRMKFSPDGFMPGVPGGSGDAEQMAKIMEAVYGSDGITTHTAVVGDRVVQVMGGDEALLERAIAAAKSGGGAPEALSGSLEKTKGAPKFLFHADLGQLVDRGLQIARKMDPDGEPAPERDMPRIPFDIYYTSEGPHYKFGMSVDAMGVVKMIMGLMQEAR